MFRAPQPEDGPAVTRLIADCPPLDANSAYCNLLQCTHFASTCLAAFRAEQLVGWVSAYRPPEALDEIFIWQAAVHPSARGTGLAGRMLDALLARPAVSGAARLTTTITQANAASWALFEALAHKRGVRLEKRPLFDRQRHFAGAHDTEWQVVIRLHPVVSRRATKKEDA